MAKGDIDFGHPSRRAPRGALLRMRSQKSFTSACDRSVFFGARNLFDQIDRPARCLEGRAAPLQKTRRAARVESRGRAAKLVADGAFVEGTLRIAGHVDDGFLVDGVR